MTCLLRQTAVDLGLHFYDTGRPCANGHVSVRRSKDGSCVLCVKAAKRRNRKKNRRRENDRKRAAIKRNPARLAKARKKRIERRKRWRLANPERAAAQDKLRRQRAKMRSHEIYRARKKAAKRQRKLDCKRACPPWADRQAIVDIYRHATVLGVDVDHIVPLRSTMVCGLHVANNLQMMMPADNQRKGNRWWPDMPDYREAA
jgi:hypothetical protein